MIMVESLAPWVRIYVDIPRDVKQSLDVYAAQQGMTKKACVAKLITDAVEPKRRKK